MKDQQHLRPNEKGRSFLHALFNVIKSSQETSAPFCNSAETFDKIKSDILSEVHWENEVPY